MDLRINQVLDNKYAVTKQIGKGAFGQVYLAINMQTKEEVAIKQMKKSEFSKQPKLTELFQTEVSMMKAIKNENVVGFIDYLQNQDSHFLIIEYCGDGDVHQFLQNQPNKRLAEYQAKNYFKQLLNGFKGLHEFMVVHRDLKCQNIFIKNDVWKLGDLGFAKSLQRENVATTVLGTSLTMAPELFENQKYGLEVDVYSLGVIFYQILFGTFPYYGKNDHHQLQLIKTQPLDLQYKGIVISEEMKDLLKKMICYNRQQRIKWDQIYEHPVFVQQQKNEIFQSVRADNLIGQRISLEQNKQMYQQQQNQQNGFQAPQFQQQQLPQKNVQIQESLNIQQIQMEIEQKKNILKQVNEIRDKYLHKRNIYGQCLKAVDQAYSLPFNSLNKHLPIFLIQKKVKCYSENLLQSLKQQQNVFNAQYFQEFLQSQFYTDIVKRLSEEQEIIQLYFASLQSEISQILNKMDNPNQQLKQEVIEAKLTQNFDNLFKENLTNYSMNLQGLMEQNQNPIIQKQLFVHMISILELCVLEKLYGNKFGFDFDHYYNNIYNTQPQQYEQLLTQRFEWLFS